MRKPGQEHMAVKSTQLAARRFLSDGRGLAALEFALLAPLLLVLYFVTMEVAQALDVNKKVNRAGGMVGDLVTQQTDIKSSELDAIMRIGEATLQPYNRSQPTVVVTAIKVSDEATPKATVDWSRQLVGGASGAGLAKGTEITIPPSLMIKGSFLIRAESALSYSPIVTWAASGSKTLNLPMDETYYLRPRMSTTISCTDC